MRDLANPKGSAGEADSSDRLIAAKVADANFRRGAAAWILAGVGMIFLILVGGSIAVLIIGILKPTENSAGALNGAQAVLTASIGFLGGAATTVLGYFFQSKEG